MQIHKEYIKNEQYISCLIDDLGFPPSYVSKTVVKFFFYNKSIQYFVKSQWLTGKGVRDGRGVDHLVGQLKRIGNKNRRYNG